MTVASVVTFKWKPKQGYGLKCSSDDANLLYRGVQRHYRNLQRFICITDDPSGLDPAIEVVPLWSDFADMPNPTYKTTAGCHRRLRIFSKDFGSLVGPRFVMLDLDTLPVGDLTPLFEQSHDFVGWRPIEPATGYPQKQFGGAFVLMTAGCRAHIWDEFVRDPDACIDAARNAGMHGSDQAWTSFRLGVREKFVTDKDGIYFYGNLYPRRRRRFIANSRGASRLPVPTAGRKFGDAGCSPLPGNARLVFFSHGLPMTDPIARRMSPWIQTHAL
jgi:hypothetical protein